MPTEVARDILIALMLASAGFAGLVVVFLATASDQIKSMQRFSQI